jgi:hypothetical protein
MGAFRSLGHLGHLGHPFFIAAKIGCVATNVDVLIYIHSYKTKETSMTQMTQSPLEPPRHKAFPLGHSPKNHDPTHNPNDPKTPFFP